MTQYGYKLSCEGFGPAELVRQAVAAEQAGFDFLDISDHYHPWLEEQGHSPFAWTVLGAIAAKTERIGLMTGVTCPSVRYHPAIIAQASATLQLLSDGRFTLGVGAGERLNEHVVGRGFPAAGDRHSFLREALEIIRLLWEGGYQSYDGRHLRLEDARVFDLPDDLPPIAVAASGDVSLDLAVDLGDGLVAVSPDADLVAGFRAERPVGPVYGEAALAWAPTVEAAAAEAHRTARWSVTGWKVMAELPNPVNFDAASATVRVDDLKEQVSCGPDVDAHVEQVAAYVEAGFDHVAIMNLGPDVDGFLEFFASELKPALPA